MKSPRERERERERENKRERDPFRDLAFPCNNQQPPRKQKTVADLTNNHRVRTSGRLEIASSPKLCLRFLSPKVK